MPYFLTSSTALGVVFALSIVGLAFAVLADHFQTLAKYKGVLNKRVAGGYNSAMKVMVINRLGAVLYFLLLAFSIDNGLSAEKLNIALAVTVASLAVPTLFLMLWLQKRLGQRVWDTSIWPKRIVIAAFFATTLNLLGLTVPWVLAAHHPELRLTLANTSFLFNTLFTVVNVFYIEHHFARIVDSEKRQLHAFVSGVMAARLFAFLVVGLGLGLGATL